MKKSTVRQIEVLKTEIANLVIQENIMSDFCEKPKNNEFVVANNIAIGDKFDSLNDDIMKLNGQIQQLRRGEYDSKIDRITKNLMANNID